MNRLSQQRLREIEAKLERRIGVDRRTLGPQDIERAVQGRMSELRIVSADEYLNLALGGRAEFQELIEQLVVPETWFFRDLEPFRCLRREAMHGREARPADATFRVLSAPCSTGEEAYSLAATLAGAGLAPGAFQVTGVDISRRALRHAKRGVYAERAFRGELQEFQTLRDRFCRTTSDGLVIDPQLQSCVHFRQGNLLDRDFLLDQRPFDAVFCRNVLIYFSEDARRLALANLKRLTRDDGFLYVGHAEGRVIADGPFLRFDREYSFAFRTEHEPAAVVAAAPSAPRVAPVASARSPVRPQRQPARPAIRSRQVAPPKSEHSPAVDSVVGESSPSLVAARSAANAGRLQEAEELCRRVLSSQPTAADAFSLLGEIAQARGDLTQAENKFRKAIYLEPRHREALVHMTLLAERRGDKQMASSYRRRAESARRAGG